MNNILIDNRKIGDGEPCFIIAEAGANFRISDNPEKNFDQALKLIDIASDSKADAVKFQLYRAEKLYVKNAGNAKYIGKDKSIYDIISEMELPYEWLKKLKNHCDKKNIIFLCSPFDEKSVDELEKINISAYKIASYTITHIPLLKYVASKCKPIILSTGASNLEDIKKAITIIKSEGVVDIILLQCTAKYPAPIDTLNLKSLDELRAKFGVIIGLSDHSREPDIGPLGAVSLGAKVIEKHFTTDNNLPGPDHGFAVLPEELRMIVDKVRKLESALGDGKKNVLSVEKELHHFCRSGIYAIKEIRKGDKFSLNNIAVLRSGIKERKLEPEVFESILGKLSNKHISPFEPIDYGDFK